MVGRFDGQDFISQLETHLWYCKASQLQNLLIVVLSGYESPVSGNSKINSKYSGPSLVLDPWRLEDQDR